MKVTDRNDWFDIWFEDKEWILNIMIHNMTADLEAGYDYFGHSIHSQQKKIMEYKAQFESEMDNFKTMDEKQVDRWCFYDMKKRGAIA
jgi:hypothetical protein